MNLPLTHLRFLHRAEQQFGSKVGVIDGTKRWTYREYGARCRQLAALLCSWDLSPGGRVAYLSYNTHHLLEAYYGVCLAGGVLVPLNTRLSAGDIRFILQDCEAEYVFVDPDFLPLLEESSSLPSLRQSVLLRAAPSSPDQGDPYEALIQGQPADAGLDVYSVGEDEVAEIFYTSGTTSRPKGVMLTHRNLYLHGLETALAIGASDSDVMLHVIPLFHVNGWGTPQYVTCMGGTHVMVHSFDPEKILSLAQEHGATAMSMVPTMATTLVNFEGSDRFDLSSMRYVTIGGAPSNPRLIRRLENLLGCECTAGYGLTETSPVLSVARLKDHLEIEPSRRSERLARAGWPVPGAEIQIFDDSDRPLPWDGVSVGEVVTRADSVTAGYLNRPEETEAAFRSGWFHTGDLGTIDPDGYLQIVDRKKDIIISGGENISTIEIEKALLTHPEVLECAVIPVPDSHWGEVPKALVVLQPGSELGESDLVAHCRSCLASFKLPKSVEFRSELPKGGTGKILKRLLREEYWSQQERRVH